MRSKAREPIIVSLAINILANVLYMYLESIPTDAKIYLILARAFVGFGAGELATIRTESNSRITIPVYSNCSDVLAENCIEMYSI